MKKIIFLFLAVVFLSGCGENKARENGTENMPEPKAVSVSFSGEAEFQPHSAENRSMGFCLELVYEPLFRFNGEGVLGECLENRGREVDIYLKKGALWHDGSEFTAEDVAYTISLITGGQSVYPPGVIEGAAVKDKSCVTVFLSACIAEPQRILTFPVVKNNSALSMKAPVGTGKYRYAGKSGFDTYLFEPSEKNSDLPHLRMIRVRSTNREGELFRAGITDIQYVENSGLKQYIPGVNSKILKYPTNHMIYIGFNCEAVPEALRRAVYYALDRPRLTEGIFGDTASAAVLPYITQNALSYKDSYSLFSAKSEAEAGGYVYINGRLHNNGTPVILRLGVQPGEGHLELAEKLSEMLGNFGIECITQECTDFDIALLSGSFHMVLGTEYTNGDLWNMLRPGNRFLYSSEEMSRLFSAIHNRQEFNNVFFRDIPFIPIAFRCDGISFAGRITDDEYLSFLPCGAAF